MKWPQLLGLALVLQSCLLSARAPTQFPDTPTVDFCELIKDSAVWDQKVVRVRATYFAAFEVAIFRDKECEGTVWATFDPTYDENTAPKVQRTFDYLMYPASEAGPQNMAVRLVVVGRFDGVKHTSTLPGGKTFSTGFGHLGGYDYQLNVLAIEEVRWSGWQL